MSSLQVSGRELEVNQKGYLVDFDAWNKDVAEAIAAEEGIRLTECHWDVIDFLRDYYRKYETSPSPRVVVGGVGHRLTLNAPCTRKTLDTLFPRGGCKQACRIAGLPDYYCQGC